MTDEYGYTLNREERFLQLADRGRMLADWTRYLARGDMYAPEKADRLSAIAGLVEEMTDMLNEGVLLEVLQERDSAGFTVRGHFPSHVFVHGAPHGQAATLMAAGPRSTISDGRTSGNVRRFFRFLYPTSPDDSTTSLASFRT